MPCIPTFNLHFYRTHTHTLSAAHIEKYEPGDDTISVRGVFLASPVQWVGASQSSQQQRTVGPTQRTKKNCVKRRRCISANQQITEFENNWKHHKSSPNRQKRKTTGKMLMNAAIRCVRVYVLKVHSAEWEAIQIVLSLSVLVSSNGWMVSSVARDVRVDCCYSMIDAFQKKCMQKANVNTRLGVRNYIVEWAHLNFLPSTVIFCYVYVSARMRIHATYRHSIRTAAHFFYSAALRNLRPNASTLNDDLWRYWDAMQRFVRFTCYIHW